MNIITMTGPEDVGGDLKIVVINIIPTTIIIKIVQV